MTEARPITILIAAMGGEGGGVFANWIVSAITQAGYPIQATSIPGVAQRTGATTYYIEILPVPRDTLGGQEPVFSLYPGAGDVDLVVASELIEAARAIQNGYVTPDRTTLIASTHRIYAIAEKTAMGDGRYDSDRVREAARVLAKDSMLTDFGAMARTAGAPINAVLLGAVARSGVLPVSADQLAETIRAGGRAVEANLAAFEAGLRFGEAPAAEPAGHTPAAPPPLAPASSNRITAFPAETHAVITEGVRRLIDYQGTRYAERYLDRLAALPPDDPVLLTTVARHLAVRMAAEDVIRVAQLKTKASRVARARAEVGAAPNQPVVISEFMKPGIEEACALLPGFLARPLLTWARRRGLIEKLHVGLRIKTTTISGFLLVWLLARMRPLRPLGHAFAENQAWIDAWLADVGAAARLDRDLAREVADCARLIKGYGETFRRGRDSYAQIRATLIAPALAGDMAPAPTAAALAGARDAALAGPDGAALSQALATAQPDAAAAE